MALSPRRLQKRYIEAGINPADHTPEKQKHHSLGDMVSDLAKIPLLHEPGAALGLWRWFGCGRTID